MEHEPSGAEDVKAIDVDGLASELAILSRAVRDGQRAVLASWSTMLEGKRPDGSLRNLAAYLAFRQTDVARLQGRLARAGLSSLGRTESHVRASVAAATGAAGALGGKSIAARRIERVAGVISGQARQLDRHTRTLLGHAPRGRRTRIMVTLGAEMAGDPDRIPDLVSAGMDCARINTAHDDADVWLALEQRVRAAVRATGRTCRVLFDLPGPKLRIGPLRGMPAWITVKGAGNGSDGERGELVLTPIDAPPVAASPGQPRLGIDRAWLADLQPGDVIEFTDARGRHRSLIVRERANDGAVRCSADRTVRFAVGVEMTRPSRRLGDPVSQTIVRQLPVIDLDIEVREGDHVRLGRQANPNPLGPTGNDIPWITCLATDVVGQLAPGQAVLIDDGHAECVVEAVDDLGVILRVLRTRGERVRLRTDQGLNFPGLRVRSAAPTDEDLQILASIGPKADLIGLSFCESASDVSRLWQGLADCGARAVGVVAKIETRRGIEELPQILATGVSRGPFGVMIARGDLAVEIGYERLAEMQEELLWLCEAAHVPVIWATQVLEALVKTGIPSRAEITDAAMAERAECVMLNKGPHIVAAVRTLVDVAERMEGHQRKKMARLRPLRTWSYAIEPQVEAEADPAPEGTGTPITPAIALGGSATIAAR